MARARSIKPGLYKNEDLAECSIWARYVFPGLTTLADREGRLEDRPKRIKAELLPFDTQDMEPLLAELARKKDAQGNPFIIRYQNEQGRFIQITKFLVHQSPHYSEKESVIKPPESWDGGGDHGGTTPGKPPPRRGGRNPLTPSSLTPDSLNPVCECPTPAHTQVRDDFLNSIRTSRADLDPNTVFQEFRSHYAERPECLTLEKWRQWIALERRPKPAPSPADALADPDSMGAVQALAKARGMPPWDGMEQFEAYKKRVREVVPA